MTKPTAILYDINYTSGVMMTDEVTGEVHRLVIRDGVLCVQLLVEIESTDSNVNQAQQVRNFITKEIADMKAFGEKMDAMFPELLGNIENTDT